MAKCVACKLGWKWECRHKGECDSNDASEPVHGTDVGDLDSVSDSGSEDSEDDAGTEFRTYKDDSALRDQQSTGRKRAAKMFPLHETELCDWAMRKNVGGGNRPITGCLTNLQQARHHGPDKNTLNNEKGNVHRICHTCHNRWHTLNDDDYVWGDVQNEHEPEIATVDEILQNEEHWKNRTVVKAKD